MNKKIRKLIVKSLITVILFSNTSTYSLSSTLSEDTRYETFKGENIKIENILQVDSVDVEIEGKTLVNYSHIKTCTAGNSPSYNTEPLLKSGNTYTFSGKISNIVNGPFSGAILRIFFTDDSFITPLDTTYEKGDFKVVFTIPSEKTVKSYYIGGVRNYVTGQSAKLDNLLILDGNWSDKNPPEYFSGIKSVEDKNNALTIKSSGKNLFDTNSLYAEDSRNSLESANFEVINDSILMSKNVSGGVLVGVKIKCEKGQTYTVGFVGGENKAGRAHSIYLYDNRLWGNAIKIVENISSTDSVQYTFIATTDELYVGLYLSVDTQIGEVIEYKNVFVYEGTNSNYERYKGNSTVLEIKEPLRALPNGVNDKIIKKNGQWVIERNCKELILDGSDDENWSIRSSSYPSDTTQFFCFNIEDKNAKTNTNIYCDRFISRNGAAIDLRNSESIYTSINGDGVGLYLRINNSRLNTLDKDGLREWLSTNPVKIVYQLESPIYESLDTIPILYLYEETTYISNNSIIGTNMQLTVDRVTNRAKEFSEIAEASATIKNLEQARYWINLMKESILKDEFQSQVNNISNISDLTLEKKNLSVNSDIYIQMKNTLSVSLDINSITFDEYSGVEDLEMLSAVSINVNSSLPYDLNVYMQSEIYNSSKTNTIPINVLNIKESTRTQYQTFASLTKKIILKQNCANGVNNKHSIDLKLGKNSSKTDVYKTVLKFEVEQN